MLKQLSRMKRAHKYVLVFFALLMGLSLVLFYAPGRNQATASAASKSEVLAEVGDDVVTVGDLDRVKQGYQNMFGGQISLAQLGGDKRFLDGLIRDRIVAQEAERRKLGASDYEVAAKIRKQFADASGKFIGDQRYRQRVLSMGYRDVASFEETVRDQIAADKLRAFVTSGVTVSAQEVEDNYRRQGTYFDLAHVVVAADKLAARVEPSEDELRRYFEEHKTEFRFLEPQRKIRYLFVDMTKVGEKLNIPDADLRAAYDQLAPDKKIAGAKAQQIVLKVANPALDQQVLEKGTRLVSEMRGQSLDVSEEKFAEVARGNSEDAATAKAGGHIPGFVRRNPNDQKDPKQQVFQVGKGQVSDPVKYGDAYYIFRRGDDVEKTFEQAKTELLVSQRNTRAYGAAQGIAARAAARLKETKDFQKVAQEFAAEANMDAGSMIKETGFVKRGDNVPDIGNSDQFWEAVEPLNAPGDVGDRVNIKNGFAVPALVEKRDPRIPDFAEVREQVVERVKQDKARAQLEQVARDLANGAGGANDLKAAAERVGLTAETLPSYRIGTAIGEAGTSAAADEAIFALKEGEVSKTPIKIGDKWVVVAAVKRKDADMAEFAKQRDTLTESMLGERRTDVFEDFVTATRARMERAGEIEIKEEVLNRVSEPAAFELPGD
jgi:peptidyl-prolyl cis-trans isomerase D